MNRSIVTRKGDGGRTRLIYGEDVSKADLQVEAYGTIDELNASMGLARSLCDSADTKDVLESLQRETFIVGAELATPLDQSGKLKSRVSPAMTARLDAFVADIEVLPGLLDDWSLPGATPAAAAIDVARAVARRAERCVVRLSDAGLVANEEILRYLNRVSDLLWLLGRRMEIEHGLNSALRA